MNIVNIADLKDPTDKTGRTYREINNSIQHKLEVGQLVELDNGARLFIAKKTRDCDGTPLYSLCSNVADTEREYNFGWVHGYDEDSLKPI